MNIYAKKGDKVKVTSNTRLNGSDYDIEKVKELLKIQYVYTVEGTQAYHHNTDVHLKEFPSEIFNSVNFEDVNYE